MQLVTDDMKRFKQYFHVTEEDELKYSLDNLVELVIDPKKKYSLVSLPNNSEYKLSISEKPKP